MNISELIARLQEVHATHGDVRVVVTSQDYDYTPYGVTAPTKEEPDCVVIHVND